ncbi:hypothetical protein [Butyrivibrio proteoclasticus]|uniref:hypothetical protein n=1 Tax=Butyrivibrio proteoclasticus TaxID=43305 RepID=UPI00047A4A6E|nr:hypothetical protein [Butyrivibrio proteoclasticus]
MRFKVTGSKAARIFYTLLAVGLLGYIFFDVYVMVRVLPDLRFDRQFTILTYSVGVISGFVLAVFDIYILHRVFDEITVYKRQIVVKRLFRKEIEFDKEDIKKWCITMNHVRYYWTSVITISIGRKYVDLDYRVHENFDEMEKYLEKYCPEKRVDSIVQGCFSTKKVF